MVLLPSATPAAPSTARAAHKPTRDLTDVNCSSSKEKRRRKHSIREVRGGALTAFEEEEDGGGKEECVFCSALLSSAAHLLPSEVSAVELRKEAPRAVPAQ